ncbi:MAG TPA: VOC family protein [Bauldia sp.]|nr:VOC family protein [Bauldia sp.]
MPSPNEAPRIFPTYRYRDAGRMIAWLTDIFGFAVHANYKDDNGVVQHAELGFGSSMIMLGTIADDAYGAMVGSAVVPGAKSTYVAVDNPDALFAKARQAGVTIEEEPTDRSYGSREFIVRDPEGNVWAFGTYWPKAGPAA